MRARRIAVFVVMIVVVLALDQSSKAWARTLPVPASCSHDDLVHERCAGVRQPLVAGYWDWELAYNRGAAFSTFAPEAGTDDAGGRFRTFAGETGAQIALAMLAGIAVVVLGAAAWRSRREQRLRRVAYAMIAGGALGNLVDRVRDGAVTDFVRWHVHDHLWPIFNVADAALLVGIGMLLIDGARNARLRRAAA